MREKSFSVSYVSKNAIIKKAFLRDSKAPEKKLDPRFFVMVGIETNGLKCLGERV